MKAKIRVRALRARNNLSRAEIAAKSRAITRRLFRLRAYQRARTVMLYLSHGSEVRTREMINRTLESGRRVALPVALSRKRRLVPVLIHSIDQDLTPGEEGILEPALDNDQRVSPAEIDLVVMPGLAFDTRGNRVGRGKAYYDIFLTEIRPAASRVALAFENQMVKRIPPAPHDAPVDWVITEKRVIRCSPGGKVGAPAQTPNESL